MIESTPEVILGIMERNEGIGRLCRNGWVQLATLHPETSVVSLFREGRFEPYRPESTELPKVHSWVEWYRGWRDHLGFAALDR